MSNEIFLMKSINALSSVFETRVQSLEHELDLSRREFHILMQLTEAKRMGALAEELQILPSTLTAIADRLEHGGLVYRLRDTQDRRAWLLDVTDAGRDLQIHLGEFAAQEFREVTGLNNQEIETFVMMMQKVMNNMTSDTCSEGMKP
ncbi:MarR family transcriptional regulator [Pseudosulfitobacter sp. DSM 107133]|jgi:DNA-binding MarR family transcriptional regulator|uniref:MarR family winged helix-turn-helix transcriptional regulator n=1 Tax=Pseudosulfitobacter sp. DSM 107133 TaxID=2883100 RepID=UPI000DF16303|nr:MarR family transcriptional regulator [Pseudosulfitobacter sp. DSM 107133]UOA25774.1 putative HTH-type transcriptional regulator YusO [Pseudosulfitobacter sp. DSM 107133]